MGGANVHGTRTVATIGAIALLGAAGCGTNNGPPLKDASDGTPFRVAAHASFSEHQQLGETRTLKVTVRNDDKRTLPGVSVVLRGLERRIARQDNGAGRVADPRRPIWIIDRPPSGAKTAYRDTWALGPLAPGAERTFRWGLTPTVAGLKNVTWQVVGAVSTAGPVNASAGSRDHGRFRVRIAREPRDTTIDPDTGRVVERSKLG